MFAFLIPICYTEKKVCTAKKGAFIMAQGKITAKQQEILDYIKDEILKRGYPPAVREICEAVASQVYLFCPLSPGDT